MNPTHPPASEAREQSGEPPHEPPQPRCGERARRAMSEVVYGLCTACGSAEVALVRATGERDLSDIGESPHYPTGYGCEVCS